MSSKRWHESGFYYLMELPQDFPFHPADGVHRNRDGKNVLEFKWVEATRQALTQLDIPHYFITGEIETLPVATKHIFWDDDNLDDK